MQQGEQGSERRTQERHAIDLPVRVSDGGATLACQSENLSVGGACLVHDVGTEPFRVGDIVDIEVDLPGVARAAKLQAEVRWSGKGRSGVMFRGGALAAVAAFVGTLFSGAPVSASTSTVPEFDPNADVALDMEAGGERPDEYSVLQAFEQQYEHFDACVAKVKKDPDQKLPGDVEVAVLLSPKGKRPLGVNAALTKKVKASDSLRQCLRTAIAGAPYPAYDGPPVVVNFSFELDPGSEYIAP